MRGCFVEDRVSPSLHIFDYTILFSNDDKHKTMSSSPVEGTTKNLLRKFNSYNIMIVSYIGMMLTAMLSSAASVSSTSIFSWFPCDDFMVMFDQWI